MEVCRWSSARVVKVYLDVVGVAASRLSQQLEQQFSHVADRVAATHLPRLLEALDQLRRDKLDARMRKLQGKFGPSLLGKW